MAMTATTRTPTPMRILRMTNFPCLFMTTEMFVRRHINWNNQRPDLKEDLAHLVDNIKRRICGIYMH